MELILENLGLKICSYCYISNPIQEEYCHHCEAPLNIERTFQKIIPKNDEYYTLDKILPLKFNEINTFNTYDLLMYLSLLRTAKNKEKKTNTPFNQSPEYILHARKAWLIENILYDKTMNYPARFKKSHFVEPLTNSSKTFNAHKRKIEQAKRYL